MATTVAKRQKSALELADLIRQAVGKPELRVGVYATKGGWKARVYPEPGDDAVRLRANVERMSAVLAEEYELVE